MPKTLSMVEARKKLTSLPEEFALAGELDAVAVTRRGKPVLAVMPWELYETITETLEVMADAEMTSILRESVAQFGRGIYGVDAAARYYWDVPVSRIGAAESIELAATLPSPVTNNPLSNTQSFRKRVSKIRRFFYRSQ